MLWAATGPDFSDKSVGVVSSRAGRRVTKRRVSRHCAARWRPFEPKEFAQGPDRRWQLILDPEVQAVRELCAKQRPRAGVFPGRELSDRDKSLP